MVKLFIEIRPRMGDSSEERSSSDSCSEDDSDTINYLSFITKCVREQSLESSDSGDVECEQTVSRANETVDSIESETFNETSELLGLVASPEKGPLNLTRRAGASVARNAITLKEGQKKNRYTGGYTAIQAGLPPLTGIAENLGWSETVVRAVREPDFTPNKVPGVVGLTEQDDPVKVFLSQVEDSFKLFLKYSNQKREELAQNGKKLSILEMKDMYAFMAANLWMDTRQLPRVDEYFSKDPLLRDTFICDMRDATGLSRNHFLSIFKSARLYDKSKCKANKTSDINAPEYDPQYKCREVLDALTISAQKCMNPERELALDESMDLFTVNVVCCV